MKYARSMSGKTTHSHSVKPIHNGVSPLRSVYLERYAALNARRHSSRDSRYRREAVAGA